MIKAINTKFKGYNMRSRLEARYGVLFDSLGLKWEYEPEWFELGDGVRYLPDFYFPDKKCYAEIKPRMDIDNNRVFFSGPISGENWRDYIKCDYMNIRNVGTYQCRAHESRQKDTVLGNFELISNSDIVVGFIYREDTPGTLIELGYAAAMGKKIILFISSDLASHDIEDPYCRSDMWIAEDISDEVYVVENGVNDINSILIDKYKLPTDIIKCAKLSEQSNRPVYLLCGVPGTDGFSYRIFGSKYLNYTYMINPNTAAFIEASNKCKSARFEHGESGA